MSDKTHPILQGQDVILEQIDHFLASIVNGLPFALFCKDYQESIGRFVAWNQRAEILWGLSSGETLNRTDFDLFPQAQAEFFQQKDLETLRGQDVVFIPEESVDSPSLGKIWVRTWKIPLKERIGKPRFLLGVSQDISEVKKLEMELKLQTEKAMTLRSLQDQRMLAANIAHELNNPLAIIIGRCKQLKRISGELSGEGISIVDSIIHTVSASAVKLDDLLKLFSSSSAQIASVDPANGSAQRKFLHDFANLITIARGRGEQARKLMAKRDDPKNILIQEKLDSMIEAIDRMQVALENLRPRE